MPHALIPRIPGVLLQDEMIRSHLNEHVAQLCGLRDGKFPGSQPVSFNADSLDLLEQKDFWVCEKSDGVRVLLLVLVNSFTEGQEVWLIDRKQNYYRTSGVNFTHWEHTEDPLTDTILDGELVIDTDPETQRQKLVFYAFDCLVLGGENIMKKPLYKRYARLREWVIAPRKKALALYPEWKFQTFEIVAKEQELSYHVAQVLDVHIPKLQHGHDGLIFTCAETEYTAGTDPMILKWKPPSENSVDFKLSLRFPPGLGGEADFCGKPTFLLSMYMGGQRYEFFDELEVPDEQWAEWKESNERLNGRLVEVVWNAERQTWRFMRFRDDKPHGNFHVIVHKVMDSIADGVEIETVLSRQDAVRAAHKARHVKPSKPSKPQREGVYSNPPVQSAAPPGLRR